MDDDNTEDEYTALEDVPGLETEEKRELWGEILAKQDDHTLEMNEMAWARALAVRDDDGNMVCRFVYEDGSEEIFDLLVRATLVAVGTPEDRN